MYFSISFIEELISGTYDELLLAKASNVALLFYCFRKLRFLAMPRNEYLRFH